MLLAHKIELRPTLEQRDYLDRACGHRRHCYNRLLEYFSQKDESGQWVNKWSKAAAYQDPKIAFIISTFYELSSLGTLLNTKQS
jgi:Helix-turn-helix domain